VQQAVERAHAAGGCSGLRHASLVATHCKASSCVEAADCQPHMTRPKSPQTATPAAALPLATCAIVCHCV
jgi:hypothetical protein